MRFFRLFTMLLLGILLNVNFTSCSKDDIVPDTEQGDNNDGSEDGNDDAEYVGFWNNKYVYRLYNEDYLEPNLWPCKYLLIDANTIEEY